MINRDDQERYERAIRQRRVRNPQAEQRARLQAQIDRLWQQRLDDEAADKALRRAIDPMNYGHWD
jgi:hypothetical protein